MRTRSRRAQRLAILIVLGACVLAAILGLVFASFDDSGQVKSDGKVEIALRSLVSECSPHGGIQSYSFRYESTNYLWTAICKDGHPVVVGGN